MSKTKTKPTVGANAPLLEELQCAIDANMASIERIATSSYFMFFFAGEEILLKRELLDECEAFLKEEFVVVKGQTAEQGWPRSQALQFFTQVGWSKATAAGKTKLSFTEWQSAQVAALPRLKDAITHQG